MADGTVWAWGNNADGQLGNATTTDSSMPVEASGLSNVTAIAGGGLHSLALKTDGTVWAWGDNALGQLGNGMTTNSSVPVQVSGLTNVTAIAGGYRHSLALTKDGTVWTWGNNAEGELGDGTTAKSSTPVEVSGLANVTAIAAGYYHSLALKADGTVWAWGWNIGGQLGDGTTTNSSAPVEVSGLSSVMAIAGGFERSLALKSDGTVWAWGSNQYGQLGNGMTTNSSAPVEVSGLSNVMSIVGGGLHSLALKSDGTAWAWGYNNDGQLGNGTITNSSVPVEVSGISNIAAVAGGGLHSLAVTGDITAPTSIATLSGPAGQNGWYTGPVTVTLSRTDPDDPSSSLVTYYTLDGGPQQTYTKPFSITADGTHTVKYWSVDPAGNVETVNNQTVMVDTSIPAITITAPAHQTYLLNQVVNASYSATDNADGIVSVNGPVPSGSLIDTASVGTKTFTVKASDTAGNSSQASVNYTVSYGVKLLYDPTVAASPGAPVPISLQLVDAAGTNVSSANITLQAVSLTADGSPASAGTGTDPAFTFQPALGGTGDYVFNLSSKGLPAGMFNLNFIAGSDPSVHQAAFTNAGPTATVPAGISMVSVPFANSGDLAALFGVKVLPDGSADIATYDPSSSQYLLYPHLPGSDGKSGLPGRGYWVEESVATKVQSSATANPIPLDVTLSPGWNMIGDPYAAPLETGSLQVELSATVGSTPANQFISESAAVSAGIVEGTIWTYDPAAKQYVAATTLTPFEGYWIYIDPTGSGGQPVTLRFTQPGYVVLPADG